MKGPGRHFYCPIWWERNSREGCGRQAGRSRDRHQPHGRSAARGAVPGRRRADRRQSGQAQGHAAQGARSGRYRINDYAFECKPIAVDQKKIGENIKYAGWVSIPTGYVGVVTNLATNSATGQKGGIQEEVLPPGIYAVNPFERQIDIVGVGFWETSIAVDHRLGRDGKELLDASGEPEAIPGSGIGFPSNDGFNIQLDFTAIWGVMPKDAPEGRAKRSAASPPPSRK